MKTAQSILLAIAVSLPLALGCSSTREPNPHDPTDPLKSPAFLTPVAQAQQMGVTPYWLGSQVAARDISFRLGSTAHVSREFGPAIGLDYVGRTPRGSVLALVQGFVEEAGGAEEKERRASSVPGAVSEQVRVASWNATLYTLPSPARSVNQLRLFVDLEDTVVLVVAFAGSTGEPRSDANPLIDKDLLIQVVAQNLRPYPE